MALTITVDQEAFHFSGRSLQPTKEKNQLLEPFKKQLHLYGLVLELLPYPEQVSFLCRSFGCARIAHNDYIQAHNQVYQNERRSLSVSEYKKEFLPTLKELRPYLTEVDKFALESAIEHADKAFQNFFEGRARYPRFVSKKKPNGNRYTTKLTNNNISVEICDGKPCIKLPKVGHIPFILPKGKMLDDILPGGVRITKATVSKKNDRFFVSLSMESIIDQIVSPGQISVRDILAGDAGLKEFLIYGDMDHSVHVENPRFIRLHERRLRRFQKMMSRRQYDSKTHTGSKNWEKAKALVAKEQLKTANQRKDFQHKLSRKIADSCQVFVCEDLNIRGMMKNHHLAKSVASVGWYGFFEKLSYKLEQKGGFVLKVDRFFASSQTCSKCGYKNPETKDLSVRSWTCPSCGTVHDRDENAKQNLLLEGIRLLTEQGICITDSNIPAQAA